MVDMNYDHILEVPDTPDRIQQPTCSVSSPAASRGITKAAGNPLPPRRIIFKTRNNSIHGQSSRGNASGAVPTPLDSGDIFKQAELARLLPVAEDLEAKSSTTKSDRTTGTSVDNGKGAEKLGLDQSSNISNNISYRGTGGRGHSCQIREGAVSRHDANRRNVNFLGVGSGLPTITIGKSCRTGTSTSDKLKAVAGAEVCSGLSPRVDEGQTVINKSKTGLSGPTPCVVPQRHVAQRKLVRNGCISPSNIAKRSPEIDEKREMCSTSGLLHRPNAQVNVSEKGNVIDLTDNSPTITGQGGTVNEGLISVNNMKARAARMLIAASAGETVIPLAANQANNSSFSESSNNKGKEIFHDVMGTKQSGDANMRRVSPRAAGDSYPIANKDITCISSEQGWRTTHNNTSKPMSLLGKMASSCGREYGSSGPSNQDHETAAGDKINGATTIQTASLGNKTIRISRRKRKYTSNSYHPGESSSSLDEPRGSCLASSNSTAARNHTSHCHDIPVINIDDVCPPEVRPSFSGSGYSNGTSVDPSIREQLESDELLARQLQEQLYNETPRVVPTEEIDAIVAMSLQNEEDAQRTSGTVMRFQNNAIRARTIQHEEDAQRISEAVRRFQTNTSGARALRSSLSQHSSRLGYDLRNRRIFQRVVLSRYPGAHIQPNIDLNDYDALLALDENNHQHVGASESQINNLPQSVVQLNSTEDPCAVCLENPSIGETIRHLPCFHKFHKECIDEWLKRKKLCPVCKCGITSS